MPEEIKTESAAATPNSDAGIVTQRRETVEVITSDGKTLNSPTTERLSGIFDKIASGKTADEAIAETRQKKEKTDKKVDKVEDKKEDVKVEEKREVVKADGEKQKESDESASTTTEAKNDRAKLTAGLFGKEGEVKKEEAAKNDETEAVKDDDEKIADDELAVLPHDKPRTAKRIQALLRKVEALNSSSTTTAKQLEDARKELETAKAATKDPRTEESIAKELSELAMYRRRYELEADPEAKKQLTEKFDGKITEAEKSIEGIFSSEAMDASMLKMIEDVGGFYNFSQITNKVVRLRDGSELTYTDLAEQIMENLPKTKADYVRAKLVDQINTRDERKRYVENEVKRANEYFVEQKKKQEEGVTKQKEYGQKVSEHFGKFFDNAVNLDWMKDVPVPADASDEQKQSVSEDNAFRAQLRSVLKKTMSSQDMAELADAALDSVAYYNERRENMRLHAKIKNLEDQLKSEKEAVVKRKQAASTVIKGGSLGAGQTAAEAKSTPATPPSLEETLARIASNRHTITND